MSFFDSAFKTPFHSITARGPVYLVAEIGLNHNNDLTLAKEMVQAAKEAGANAVKFQSFTTDLFVNKEVEKARPLYDIFQKYELTEGFHHEINSFCQNESIDFFSTPLTLDWPARLAGLKVPFLKIASGDVNNFALLLECIEQRMPLVVSTGASNKSEIERLVSFFREKEFSQVIFLHCISLYPTEAGDANLATIAMLAEMTGALVGFSDHTAGADAAFGAAMLGACLIEKHFTLDKNLDGPDHKISADPVELASVRQKIDLAVTLLGEPRQQALERELAGDFFGKRSLYYIDGRLVPMRPRQPGLPKDSDYLY